MEPAFRTFFNVRIITLRLAAIIPVICLRLRGGLGSLGRRLLRLLLNIHRRRYRHRDYRGVGVIRGIIRRSPAIAPAAITPVASVAPATVAQAAVAEAVA